MSAEQLHFSKKNWCLSRKNKILAGMIIAYSGFVPSSPMLAAEFCVASQDEMIAALEASAANQEDDTIRIVDGTVLHDIEQPPMENNFGLTIQYGYLPSCRDRVPAPPVEELRMESRPQSRAVTPPLPEGPQQSTSGPEPPVDYRPARNTLPLLALTRNAPEPGEIITKNLSIPAYFWHHGCGPTAVGMVLGYWDTKGYDLIDGDAISQTQEVNQAIASENQGNGPGHYEDYSQPIDTYSATVLKDKSGPPQEEVHVADSLADYMQTSWSSERNKYGWSWSKTIIPAFTTYVHSRLPADQYTPMCSVYTMGGSLTWELLKQEIDNDRPMVFLTDSNGDGRTDHFVTVVGYRVTSGNNEYGCLDTYQPVATIRWEQFRSMSSAYKWGIWGGWTFQIDPPISASQLPSPPTNLSIGIQ